MSKYFGWTTNLAYTPTKAKSSGASGKYNTFGASRADRIRRNLQAQRKAQEAAGISNRIVTSRTSAGDGGSSSSSGGSSSSNSASQSVEISTPNIPSPPTIQPNSALDKNPYAAAFRGEVTTAEVQSGRIRSIQNVNVSGRLASRIIREQAAEKQMSAAASDESKVYTARGQQVNDNTYIPVLPSQETNGSSTRTQLVQNIFSRNSNGDPSSNLSKSNINSNVNPLSGNSSGNDRGFSRAT